MIKRVTGKQAMTAFKPEQPDGRIIFPGKRRKCQQVNPTLVYILNYSTHEKITCGEEVSAVL